MKKYLYLFAVLSVLFSCSPDSDDILSEKEPHVNLEIETSQITVDQVVNLIVNSDQPLHQITGKTINGTSTWEALEDESLPGTFPIYLKFPSPGTHRVELEFTFDDQSVITREFEFEVARGNSVQLTRVDVNSFRNINGIWDPEFENDQEGLADLVFSLEKIMLSDLSSEEGTPGQWYRSETKENQKELSWNLSEEDLYLDPNLPFYFALSDNDGNTEENLLVQPSRQIFLKDYLESRPESISLVDASSNLNVRFYLDWP